MYRAFAHEPSMRINLGIRRRLAPLVGNNRRNIELMSGLLYSLPGTPVLYYGDEIGMGDNVFLGDRNGVRTPMQWSPDRNAGFSRTNPQRLILPVIIDPEYHYESLNVESQQANPNSLLWWTKRLIALRKRFQAFGRGTIEFLSPENPKVLSFIRQFEDETVLVVANLSRYPQYVELDLKQFKDRIPVELIGKTRFPAIGEMPYLLTLGEHGFYWFSIEAPAHASDAAREAAYQPPALELTSHWQGMLNASERAALELVLPVWLEGRRWFESRDREITSALISDAIPLDSLQVVFLKLEFSRGESETWALPLAVRSLDQAAAPQSVIASFRRADGSQALLLDALADPASAAALLAAIRTGTRSRGALGSLESTSRGDLPGGEPRFPRTELQSAAVIYGDSAFLRFYRRLGEGVSPDLEILRTLGERAPGAPLPQHLASLALRPRKGDAITLASVVSYMPNQGTAWQFIREELRRFYERALATSLNLPKPPPRPPGTLVELAGLEAPAAARELLGSSLVAARLLGKRTADMHLALGTNDPAFAPEPYSALDQRSIYQTKRNLTGKVVRQVRSARMTGRLQELGQQFLAREKDLYRRFEPLLSLKMTAQRQRIHGAYHLANLLWTGKDYVVVNFDGDLLRPLPERRRKRSPLRDVASMIRSFDYASSMALRDESVVREADRAAAEPWTKLWNTWVTATFLSSYLEGMGTSPAIPRSRPELELLLDTQLLEKALDELGAEVGVRENWAFVSLRALLEML